MSHEHPNQFALLGQRRFAPFFWTQFLGAANDNVFKFAFTLMVTYQLQLSWLEPKMAGLVIGALFILPYVLFSATSGQLADKHDKARLMQLVKSLEIAIMVIAAWGFWTTNVPALLACVFLMGLHSTLFGPVKFAYLPQHLAPQELTGGNGMVEMGTFVAILLGNVAGGLLIALPGVGAQATAEGIRVQFEGLDGTKSEGLYDLVLQAVGRVPNGKRIGADKAGVVVGERGFIPVDVQMRTNVPHIFAIGDIVGQPMLAHKAVHEAHVAAEVIAGELLGDKELSASAFNARVIPSVAYTDPEVAWVGLTEDQAKAQGIKVKKGLFPWSASGRAIANGRDEGVTKLLFDDSPEAHGHGKILGGGMVGTHAGDMIGEIALAIEMGADAVDIGKTIHPHPTLGESIGMAAEVAHGSCTDLPPQKK